MADGKILTYLAAKGKIESYCAYQERSQQEVRDKLYSWGLHSNEVENLIVELITENFLNEERFALAYASGKHRIKKWGKYKIKQGLKQRAISDPLIRIALNSLDPDEYLGNLQEVLEKKATSLRQPDRIKAYYQLVNYGLNKGYEKNLIIDILNDNDLQII